MADCFLTSDPSAWMRSYWADLHRTPFFGHLALELKALALAAAIEAEHPDKAQEIREWNRATRVAMLEGLDQALRERHAERVTELWRLGKNGRDLRCVAVYMRTGLDLRLLEDGDIRLTQLFEWAHLLQAQAQRWHRALRASGWHDNEEVERKSPKAR